MDARTMPAMYTRTVTRNNEVTEYKLIFYKFVKKITLQNERILIYTKTHTRKVRISLYVIADDMYKNLE
jgi:hypothetical protein